MLPVICAVDDLIFATRIRAAARALGIEVRLVRQCSELADATRTEVGQALVDLELGSAAAPEVIRTLRRQFPELQITAYCPHVQTHLVSEAREAGASRVLPRSQFSAQLDAILSGAFASEEPEN